MSRMNIENVVASTSLGQELDLNAIEEALDGAEYNPQQFPGLACHCSHSGGSSACTAMEARHTLLCFCACFLTDKMQNKNNS